MSRTYRTPFTTQISQLSQYAAWQEGSAEWLERVMHHIELEIRDGAKMGSASKDRKQLLQSYRSKRENFDRQMVRAEMRELEMAEELARKETRNAWWREQCDAAIEYDIYMHYDALEMFCPN